MLSELRLVMVLGAFVSIAAHGATITADSAGDTAVGGDANCTLREAIENANLAAGGDGTGGDCVAGDAGADEIDFAGNYTIVLSGQLPAITDDLTVSGNGMADTVISGDDTFRVMRVDSGSVNLSDLALVDGRAQGADGSIGELDLGGGGGGGAGQGGGLYIAGGSVVASGVVFDGNLAAGGNGGDAPDAGPPTNFGGGGGPGGSGSLGATGGLGGATNGNGGGGGGGGAGGGVGGNDGGVGSGGGGGGIGGRGGAIGGGNGGTGAGCGGGSSNQFTPRDFAGAGGTPDVTAGANCRRGGGGGGGGGLGGAVFVSSGSLDLVGVDFSDNSATGGAGGAGDPADGAGDPGQGKGGAIFVDTAGSVINASSSFTGNSASDPAGTCLDNDDVYSRGSFGGATPSDLALSGDSVAENQPSNTLVGEFSTIDSDCVDSFTYALVAGSGDTGNGAFQLSGDELRTDASFDFEAQSSYSIRVRTTDSFGQFREEAFTINVQDVNEAPVASPSTFSILESAANATVVGSVAASDPESDPLQYSIVSGNTGGAFAIGAGSGEITVDDAGQIDFEVLDQYTLIVIVSDNATPALSDSTTITIDVIDINETPSIDPATFSVDENPANGTPVGMLAASDPDGDPLAFSIIGGNIGNAFAVDGSGQITVANGSQVDFETLDQYTLTVEASDDGSPVLSDAATITVNVNDLNEAPTVNPATFSVDENPANGTAVGTVSASDPETDPLSYAITAGNVDSAFAIDAAGEITVADGTQIDFESLDAYSLSVEVTDDGSPALSDTANITVDVNDLNEAPTVDPATFGIDENPADGTALGTVSASDPDEDALSYAIIAGNVDDAFSIDAGGQITVADGTQIDFENLDQYSLTVQATDDGTPGLTDDATVIIEVNGVNEAPTAVDETFSASEDDEFSAAAPGVLSSDTDPEDDPLEVDDADTTSALGAVVSVNPDGSFDYDPSAVAAIQALDDGEQLSDTFSYTVTDGAFTDTGTVTVVVAGATATLSIDKATSLSDPVAALAVFDFFLSVDNAGPGDAQQAVVTDDIPPSLEFIEANCGSYADGTLTWELGLLESGGSAQCTVTVRALQIGGFVNIASLASLDGPTITASAGGDSFALPVPAVGPAGLIWSVLALMGVGLVHLARRSTV